MKKLFLAFSGRFRDYFCRHGLSYPDAEDVTQDVFVRILRSFDTVRQDARFTAWVWSIARNTMIDRFRSMAREPLVDTDLIDQIETQDKSAQAQLEALEHKECVRRQFECFANHYPERAQCLIWISVDELSVAEIAALISRTPAATREYLYQTRKKLRPYLERCIKEQDE